MILVLLLLALAPAGPAISDEARLRSPYLACAADLADKRVRSARPVAQVQSEAELKCAPWLEANVSNSLAVMLTGRDAVPKLQQLLIKDQLRQSLAEQLKTVVANRLLAQRAALPKKR